MSNQQILILASLILLAAIGYRIYTKSRSAPQIQAGPPDPNLAMPELAGKAVKFAAERGVTLDYSPAWVKAVESLLAQLHDARTMGQLNDTEVNHQALHFGAYIGEVLRRKYGGSWAVDHPVGGPFSFPIHYNGGDSFPVGWCGKRILNGAEDNVWFKFQMTTSEKYQPGELMKKTNTSGPATE